MTTREQFMQDFANFVQESRAYEPGTISTHADVYLMFTFTPMTLKGSDAFRDAMKG